MKAARLRHWISEFVALGLWRALEIQNPTATEDVEEIHEAASVVGMCVYGSPEHGFTVHSKI